MANTAQARKRARQAEKRRQANASVRSAIRTHIKKVLQAIESKDAKAAQDAYRTATSAIDKGETKKLIHKNAAARYKSRLNARLRGLSAG